MVTGGVGVTVHAKVVPVTFEVKFTSVELFPEQTDWLNGVLVTIGLGFTVTTWVVVGPGHPEKPGVTV
jgi:hypothetical protein